MLKKIFIDNLLTAGAKYVDFAHYRRILLTNALLYITATVLYVFALLNYFLLDNLTIFVLNIIAGTISIYGIVMYRRTHNLNLAIRIGTVNLFLFFIPFSFVNQNQSFGLIWTVVFPLFAIQLNGRKRGFIYVAVFYTMLWMAAYHGIGTWQSGMWDFTSFSRLVIASSVVTYIIYSNEFALEITAKKLDDLRAQEQDHSVKLKHLSITDGLTHLYNRRYFNEKAPKLLEQAKKQGFYCGFFILDVDWFKNYNDRYGHQKGDAALIEVAKTIDAFLRRRDDFAFRLGGEEFAGIMISREESFLHENAQAIVDAIKKLSIEHDGSEHEHLTASMGLKIIKPTETLELSAVYKQADDALYRAKSQGRNHVVTV